MTVQNNRKNQKQHNPNFNCCFQQQYYYYMS